jgi:hypothetical protein
MRRLSRVTGSKLGRVGIGKRKGPAPSESRGVLVGVAPARLAVPPEGRLPKSVSDDDHELVAKQALEWQQTAGKANFWEAGAAAQGAEEGRAYALAGQMASAGEQLALAYASAVEVALWMDFREKSEPDPEHEMSMRGMAEAQCLFVMGTGHAVANVAVRALALHPALREKLIEKFRRGSSSPTFAPFSQDRADWVSLNVATCEKIDEVAQSCGTQEVIRLVEPIVRFGTEQSWKNLVGRRGEDFHRWRPQSHGIEGVPRSSPWERRGNSRKLSLGHPTYTDGRDRADETASLASEAMIDLALSMKAFIERWPPASRHLGGPRFQLA